MWLKKTAGEVYRSLFRRFFKFLFTCSWSFSQPFAFNTMNFACSTADGWPYVAWIKCNLSIYNQEQMPLLAFTEPQLWVDCCIFLHFGRPPRRLPQSRTSIYQQKIYLLILLVKFILSYTINSLIEKTNAKKTLIKSLKVKRPGLKSNWFPWQWKHR